MRLTGRLATEATAVKAAIALIWVQPVRLRLSGTEDKAVRADTADHPMDGMVATVVAAGVVATVAPHPETVEPAR